MIEAPITETRELVIRRLILEPGEATAWHRDACRRFTVVIRGSYLDIEYLDSGERVAVDVGPGHVGWDEPDQRVHRAINQGTDVYEEVVTFYRDGPHVDVQPRLAVDTGGAG